MSLVILFVLLWPYRSEILEVTIFFFLCCFYHTKAKYLSLPNLLWAIQVVVYET